LLPGHGGSVLENVGGVDVRVLVSSFEVGGVLGAVEAERAGGALGRSLLAESAAEGVGFFCEFSGQDVVGAGFEGVGRAAQETDLVVGPGQRGVDPGGIDVDGEQASVGLGFVDEEQDATYGECTCLPGRGPAGRRASTIAVAL